MSIGYSVGERIYAFVGGVEWFQVSPSTVVQYKLNVKYEKKKTYTRTEETILIYVIVICLLMFVYPTLVLFYDLFVIIIISYLLMCLWWVCFNNARIAQQLFLITQSDNASQVITHKSLKFNLLDNVQNLRFLQDQLFGLNVGVSGARAVIN